MRTDPMPPEVDIKPFLDTDSFETVFRLYNAGLKVYALRMVRQLDVAEDIVHDVFVNVWLKRKNVGEHTVKAYLFTSVRNECLKYLQHLKVRTSYQQQTLQRGDVPGALTWDYYVRTELESRIALAVEKLSPQQRKIFLMSREEHKTSSDIGAELGLSPRTVEKHMEMALAKLKLELADYLPLCLLAFSFVLRK